MDPDKSLMLARIWWRASPNLRALLSDILALSPDEHRHIEPDIHALLAIRRRELHKRDARQAEERSPEEARDETAVATDARTSGSESETAAGADEGGREVSPAPAFTDRQITDGASPLSTVGTARDNELEEAMDAHPAASCIVPEQDRDADPEAD